MVNQQNRQMEVFSESKRNTSFPFSTTPAVATAHIKTDM